MGKASQRAQSLPQCITSLSYVIQHDHIVILLVLDHQVLGIHKVGVKHLFQFDGNGQTHELDAFCCLDFYVHESMQRKGYGKLLFKVAEAISGLNAALWAFDRPSPKLFSFLAKNYNMQLQQSFKAQVSKFAMHENAIHVMGSAFSHLLTDVRTRRVAAAQNESGGFEFALILSKLDQKHKQKKIEFYSAQIDEIDEEFFQKWLQQQKE